MPATALLQILSEISSSQVSKTILKGADSYENLSENC